MSDDKPQRKWQPVDPDITAAHFADMPQEELDMVSGKMEEEKAKRKPAPDFARMSDAELREYNRKHFGF